MIAAFIVLNSDLTTTNKALFTALHRRVAKVNILITNLHWLLFIHKIYSSTCFEPQVLIFSFWPCIMNWLYINYQLDALIIIYLFITYYIPLHVSSLKCSSSVSDRTSWIDYILITNLMHWLLFIHNILYSSTCFEPQVLIFSF